MKIDLGVNIMKLNLFNIDENSQLELKEVNNKITI